MEIRSFYPQPRLLMGPGPSDVSDRVLSALSRPTIGHLDPDFIFLMDEIKLLLQYAFQTDNALTLPVSAPGSAGMETVFVNLIEPGDKVVVCRNGAFGERMRENVVRCGGHAVMVDSKWGEAVQLDQLERALDDNPDAVAVAAVHAETSTGVCSDVQAIATLADKHNCLSIIDAVTSLGGIPVKVDEWGIDAIYSGTQKCLSCVPGLSPVSFNDKAVQRITARKHPVQSWFLDLNLVIGYWGKGSQTGGKRSYHHTAPVNNLYALHESLLMLKEETLSASWQRHQLNHQALKAGIECLGLSFAVSADVRLPQLNTINVPEGVNEAQLRQQLLNDWQIEIGAGLGDLAGKVWRIGLMGHSASQPKVLTLISALAACLVAQGGSVDSLAAVKSATKVYESAGN
ncbi:alanine--glyoxylate aminotransferase [Pseudohongiella nitratireducens]|uniref:Alanine--glyoxylate aminotransferase n=1 Tax=Pseudohongiella nitratireducens TaxID=1768907 RepID=A0A916QKM5_9GAMM|nr:alanine--glyoxylate aminotransferase family protein [Pseudohongiella nitratireducens]GFZ78016.1 alanine--glyoxylate aminotransferase [Pseudohongiella nitratireducens]